jgi:hypothetical protein
MASLVGNEKAGRVSAYLHRQTLSTPQSQSQVRIAMIDALTNGEFVVVTLCVAAAFAVFLVDRRWR